MSQLETAMGMATAVFDKYAKTEDDTQTLTKAELKTLLEKELPNFLSTGKDKGAIDKVFRNLDENGDFQVDFKEFVIFVAALTCCCHKYFEQKAAKQLSKCSEDTVFACAPYANAMDPVIPSTYCAAVYKHAGL
ncbi:protein S100-P [Cygnus olor]|uniref:protein S100-P n=1 Tax=Cygnus olor TaxID=8869 RepID=UPI001ADE0CA2|nr:protein S100-P [Cygnus olor]